MARHLEVDPDGTPRKPFCPWAGEAVIGRPERAEWSNLSLLVFWAILSVVFVARKYDLE